MLLQTDTTAKLVRVGADGTVRTFDLPAATVPYSVRLTNENKCVVQAGRLVTAVTYRKYTDTVTNKLVTGWQQQNITFPEDETEVGLEVAYDAAAQTIGDHLWYFTMNGTDVVQEVVCRKVP